MTIRQNDENSPLHSLIRGYCPLQQEEIYTKTFSGVGCVAPLACFTRS